MPFRLTNIYACFISLIYWILNLFFDISVIVYLDNALIFLHYLFHHKWHNQEVFHVFLKPVYIYNKASAYLVLVASHFLSFIYKDKCSKREEIWIFKIFNKSWINLGLNLFVRSNVLFNFPAFTKSLAIDFWE